MKTTKKKWIERLLVIDYFLVIAFLIILSAIPTFAQTAEIERLENIISQATILEDHGQEILELTEAYLKEDIEKGIAFGESMLDTLQCKDCACIRSGLLYHLGYGYGRNSNFSKTIVVVHSGIEMTYQCPVDTFRPYLYRDLAIQFANYISKDQKYIDSALHYMELCLFEAPQKMSLFEQLSSEIASISILAKAQQYEKALNKAALIKPKVDSLPARHNLRLTLAKNLGSLYAETKDFDQAIYYFEKAVGLAQSLQLQKSLIYFQHFLGYLYNKKSRAATDDEDRANWLKKTIDIYNASLKPASQKGHTKDMLYAYQAIGSAQWRLNQIEAARNTFQEGFNLALKENNEFYIIKIGSSFAALLGETDGHWQCLEVLTQIEPFIKNQYLADQAYYFQTKAEALQKTGQFEEAIKAYGKAVDIYNKNTIQKDSIFQVETIAQLKELEVKYETQQKDQEIAYQKTIEQKQLAQLKLRSYFLIALLLALISTGVILYIINRNRKRSEQQKQALAILNTKLQVREQELEGVNTKLRRFAYSLSHDIFSKLDVILTNNNIAKTRANKDLILPYLHNIADTTNWLKTYGKELLHWSEHSPIYEERTPLKKVVEDILAPFDQKIKSHHISIEQSGLDVAVAMEAAALKQLLLNLIENAIKYTSKEEIPMIHITAIERDLHLNISVEDNGPGISPSQLNNILNPALNQRHGLKIVQSILDSLGQELKIEQSDMGGSKFSFLIPKALT